MSDESADRRRFLQTIDDWFSALVSGIVGKLILLSIVPITVWIGNAITASALRTEQRFETIQQQIKALSEQTRDMQYRQGEIIRHVRVIEHKVLGFSTFSDEQALSKDGALFDTYRPPITTPLVPQPPRAPTPPGKQSDGGAWAIDPTRRRLGTLADVR
jgi:hypothetical protein